MFHTGKPEEADKEQNETMDCLKYVLDGNISLRVLRKNHLSHVCIVKGGFYAISFSATFISSVGSPSRLSAMSSRNYGVFLVL